MKETHKYKKSFIFHYINDGAYYSFEFTKEKNIIKMSILCDDESFDFVSNIDFSYSFLSLKNNNLFSISHDFKYIILNNDVKIAKIYFEKSIIFETNNFMSLFN